MNKLLQTITAWASTIKDKTQAKLDIQRVETWVESLNPIVPALSAGTEKLPVLPPNVPAWANTIAVKIQSDIDTNPDELAGSLKDINFAISSVVKLLTDEIATFNAPDANATDSEIAVMKGLSILLELANTKPNHEVIQKMGTTAKELCGYVPKIKNEAIAVSKKKTTSNNHPLLFS